MENGYITDIAGIISEPDRALISEMLYDFEKSTGTHTAVLTVNSVADYGRYLWLSDFAAEVFDTWGVGNRKYDNGILLVVAIQDRTVNFHMGSAFKGAFSKDLPEITQKHMLAYFSRGEVSRGIFEGTRELVKRVSLRKTGPDFRPFIPYMFAAVLLVMAAFVIRYLRLPGRKNTDGNTGISGSEASQAKGRQDFGRAGIAGFSK